MTITSQTQPSNQQGIVSRHLNSAEKILDKFSIGKTNTSLKSFPGWSKVLPFVHPKQKYEVKQAPSTQGATPNFKFREPTEFSVEVICITNADKDSMIQFLNELNILPKPTEVISYYISHPQITAVNISKVLLKSATIPTWEVGPMTFKFDFMEESSVSDLDKKKVAANGAKKVDKPGDKKDELNQVQKWKKSHPGAYEAAELALRSLTGRTLPDETIYNYANADSAGKTAIKNKLLGK